MLISQVFFLNLIHAEEALLSSANQTIASQWEQAESRKIFGEARRYQLESKLIDALKLYSEILEFFPNTDVWPLTCIQISELYLEQKNFTASQKVLKRLLSYRSAQGLAQDENALLAQWDFFKKLNKIDDLILWLEKRNELEKKILNTSNILEKRLQDIARNLESTNLTDLKRLFLALGSLNPLQSMIGLMDDPNFLYSEQKMVELMQMSMAATDLNILRRIVFTMQKAGWAKAAHLAFLSQQHHPESNSWQRLWVQLLLEARLWPEAEALLKDLPQKDWAREFLLSSIGQSNWEQAFLRFKEMENWIFSSLTLEDTLTLAKGLSQNPNHSHLYHDFLNIIPEGSKKDLLLATLSQNQEEKIQLLEKVKKDSYYEKKASLELGKIYQRNRDLDKIQILYESVQQKYPDCSEAKELDLILKTLKSLQKPNAK